MGSARPAGPGFSPLDEELGLLPGGLSPTLAEGLVRLGALLPFRQAAEHLAFFWRVPLSEATARRHAEAAGAAYAAVQAEAAERLEREAPPPPPGPAVQLVGADGAMVPLVAGEWAEAKTLVIGTVEPAGDGSGEARAADLSYFSRLADHATFRRGVLVEAHRRGTEAAGTVVGVMDGADWLQGFLDFHRPDAVRVLDFPHAVGHLAEAARACFGAETPAATAWLAEQAHELKHGAPERVLAAVRALPAEAGAQPDAVDVRAATLGYLEKRRAQLRYAEFRAHGYPIASGSAEGGNKTVVQARLKGCGMRWARAHVDPMLALRTITCSGRWAEAWPQICARLRAECHRRRAAPRRARRPPPAPPSARPAAPPPTPRRPRPPRIVDGRPTADHPWRRPFLPGGRRHARAQPKL
jgi:hypothetical protein